MNIKELEKYVRYTKILKVAKENSMSSEEIAALIFKCQKIILLDCKIMAKYGYMDLTLRRIKGTGRKAMHFQSLVDTITEEQFEIMLRESAEFWQKHRKPKAEPANKLELGKVPQNDIKDSIYKHIYAMAGINTDAVFKQIPDDLIRPFDIDKNKAKVNDTIKQSRRKSPKNYPGTSTGMVW